MSTRRIIFGFLVCFSIAVFVGQTLSQTRNVNRKQRQQQLELHRQQRQIDNQLRKQREKQNERAGLQEEPMKQALKATEKQWKAIKPKLDKVRELTSRANVSIRLMCVGVGGGGSGMGGSSVTVNNGFGRGFMSGTGFGSNVVFGEGELVQKQGSASGSSSPSRIYYGWRWLRPSLQKGLGNLNEGEKICEELFSLLEGNNSELEEIRQKMEALRKFRQEAKKELSIAQQELRELVTPHQEATLVMMQLLD